MIRVEIELLRKLLSRFACENIECCGVKNVEIILWVTFTPLSVTPRFRCVCVFGVNGKRFGWRSLLRKHRRHDARWNGLVWYCSMDGWMDWMDG